MRDKTDGLGWLYVVALIDIYTRRIVSWSMGSTLDAEWALSALRMALARPRPSQGLIVHSDRGAQFASAAYRTALVKHRLLACMSRQGNCYDNAYIESFWNSLKIEAIFGGDSSNGSNKKEAIRKGHVLTLDKAAARR